jgi:periplasmic protein TonB
MEKKKNPKADLENKRTTFFSLGLVITLSLLLFAFRSGKEITATYVPTSGTTVSVDNDVIPPTWEKKEQPKTVVPTFLILDKINIVDNNTSTEKIDILVPTWGGETIEIPEMAKEPEDTSVVLIPGVMPEFPGGLSMLNYYLSKNIRYPQKAIEIGLAGRVYVAFVVDKDGSISNARVTRGIDPLLDEEALRVVKSMPKWSPGLQNDKPVRVSYNMFVTFKIE